MIKKIETIYDFCLACRHMPEFMGNHLNDLKDLLDEEIHEEGWYWDDEKEELFSPFFVLSDPSYDMVFIMKDSLKVGDDYPRWEFVNWVAGQTFFVEGHPDWSKEKLLNEYVFEQNTRKDTKK